MDWQPNVDAVGYFCQEIWPAVLAKVPDAKFRVVGRNPDRRVLQLASNSIEVTGRVPSVLEHLHQATVVVVPLRIAGGTRLKIYEAMAAGRAVVSTSVGAEGLDVHDGKDVILADHPASFANSIVGLLQDRELRRRYERAAIESAAQHNWPVIGKKFEDILVRVASRSVASPVQHVATMEA
jgi:glycosyltransferase involved in cell wall biosynthesis